MSKSIKRIVGTALPLAGLAVPGIGTLGATALGAAGGALSGGGLKGALIGGATGGLGSSLSSGSLSNTILGRGLNTITSGAKDLFTGGFNPAAGAGAATSSAGTGSLGGISSIIRPASTILGGISDYRTQGKIEDELLDAQRRAEAQLNPYAQAGATALENMQAPSLEALQSDPGYQFRLSQGNQALSRNLAASGLGQSGAALKAAQEYGQGLADQTYNDYFNRQALLAGRGQEAAGGLSGLAQQTGQIGAEAIAGKSNVINRTLADLLRGRGALPEEENRL